MDKGEPMIPVSVLISLIFAVAAVIFLMTGIVMIRKKRFFRLAANITLGLLMLSLAALFGTVSIATHGYRVLTKEETIAVIKVIPTDHQRFSASFSLTDGKKRRFDLAGDELYVDAHILKWKPVANILGFHTSYELDRISGRYTKLEDEAANPRTVFSIAQKKPVNMFELRRKYPFLKPLLDTEYGSATFIPVDRTGEFELRVSTTGLLIRRYNEKRTIQDGM
jgi:hypothetical protein